MDQINYSLEVKVKGPMPPFYKIPIHLWGVEVDFDSDGDSYTPESTNWRELTLIKRPNYDQRIDIDPVDQEENILKITASSKKLLEDAFLFLYSLGSVEKLER